MLKKWMEKMKRERGFATAIAVWILFILLGLVLAFEDLMISEVVTSGQFVRESKVFGAAEEGVGLTLARIVKQLGDPKVKITEVMAWSQAPPITHVVISEVYYVPATSSDEDFIELYNPLGSPQDLTGWVLKKKTSSGTPSNILSFSPVSGDRMDIPAKSYYLIRDSNHPQAGSADATRASIPTSANNTVLLYDDSSNIVDKVGWGGASDFEGSPATSAGAGQSIVRKTWSGGSTAGKATTYDSDNNANDFVTQAPDPDNSSVSEPIDPNYSSVSNEVGEFIEIYNNSDAAIDLVNYTIQVGSGPDTPIVPFGSTTTTLLPARQTALIVGTNASLSTIFDLAGVGSFDEFRDASIPTYTTGQAGLDNGNDMPDNTSFTITLKEGGTMVDQVNYPEGLVPSQNKSIERIVDWSQSPTSWRISLYEKGTPGYPLGPIFHYGGEWAAFTRDASGNQSPLSLDIGEILINVVDEGAKLPVNHPAFATGTKLYDIAKYIPMQADGTMMGTGAADDLINFRPWVTSEDLMTVSNINPNYSGPNLTVYSDNSISTPLINVNTADTGILIAIGRSEGLSLASAKAIAEKIVLYRLGANGVEDNGGDDQYFTDRSHLYSVLTTTYTLPASDVQTFIRSPHLGFTSSGYFRILPKGIVRDEAGNIEIEKRLNYVIKVWNKSPREMALLFFQEENKNGFPYYREGARDVFYGN